MLWVTTKRIADGFVVSGLFGRSIIHVEIECGHKQCSSFAVDIFLFRGMVFALKVAPLVCKRSNAGYGRYEGRSKEEVFRR